MKEAYRPVAAELTRSTASPRLKAGDIFMAEPTSVKLEKPIPHERGVQKPPRPSPAIAITSNWREALGQNALQNPDTRSTARLASEMGIEPEAERLEKARDLLQKPTLSPDEAQAIVAAHRVGEGQQGNDASRDAEIGNYTREQLREKAEILRNAGIGKQERRVLMEAGVVGKEVDRAGITDPALGTFLDEYDSQIARERTRAGTATGDVRLGSRYIENYIERLQRLKDEGTVNPAQALNVINQLREQTESERQAEQQEEQRGRNAGRSREGDRSIWHISPEDQIKLKTGTIEEVESWVNKHFNVLLRGAERSGIDPQQDDYWRELQTAISEAKRLLVDSPERADAVISIVEARSRNIVLSSAISAGDTEQVKKTAQYVLASNVIMGHAIDGGKASRMAHRAEELLEEMRLATFDRGEEPWKRGHVTPKMMEDLRHRLTQEYMTLAKAGVGEYGEFWERKAVTAAEEAAQGRGDYVKQFKEQQELHPDLTIDEIKEHIKETAMEDEIRRVRFLALNLMKNTQREGEIASRGHELYGLDSYFSSSGAVFKAFNPETFFFDKWDLMSEEEQKLHEVVFKGGMVRDWLLAHPEEKLNAQQQKVLGDLLFKEMFSVNDFASSGWRAKGILQAQKEYFERREILHRPVDANGQQDLTSPLKPEEKERAIAKAKDFALFLRIKGVANEEEEHELGTKKEGWEKIIQYRPDSLIHMLRIAWPEDSTKIPRLRAMNAQVFASGFGVTDYDSFMQKFGQAIRAVREEGFQGKDPKQVDFSHLTPEEKASLTRYLAVTMEEPEAAANAVEDIFKAMKTYIITGTKENPGIIHATEHADGSISIKETLNKKKEPVFEHNEIDDFLFTNMNKRAWQVDDMLFDKIQNPTLNAESPAEKKVFEGYTPVSRIWASDPSNDGLVRDFGDIDDGDKAVTAYVTQFIKAVDAGKKIEGAIASAEKMGSVDGQLKRAEVMRYTAMEFIAANAIPDGMDALGIQGLPFELPLTKAQEILGPHAKPMPQSERIHHFNQLRQYMVGSVKTATEKETADAAQKIAKIRARTDISEKERAERIHHVQEAAEEKIEEIEKNARKFEDRARVALRIRKRDRVKLAGISLLFALFALAVAEAAELVKDTPEFAPIGGGGHH